MAKFIYENQTMLTFIFTLVERDDNGASTAVNISSMTAVGYFQRPDGEIKEETLDIHDGANGKCRLVLTATDTDFLEPYGPWKRWAKITNAGNLVAESTPVDFDVYKRGTIKHN